MDKQVINADVPTTGGPFNLCIRHGNMVYVSGLPPFDEQYSRSPSCGESRRRADPALSRDAVRRAGPIV